MIRAVLTDIEGTTSSLSFVKDVLFPYARTHLAAFVRRHAQDPRVAMPLDAVRREAGDPGLSLEEVINHLIAWIDQDRKITPLKTLQGMIWENGYRNGDFQGHIYADAVQTLRDWKARGLDLFVYSSGSVQAQKLLFAHTGFGDLTPLFSGYFDTTVGGKLDSGSYRTIAAAIGVAPAEILFLSDVRGELDAAAAAGCRTVWLVRDGAPDTQAAHHQVSDFRDIDIDSQHDTGRDAVTPEGKPKVDLFTPIKVGPLMLPNRIVMAPLTRNRAGPGDVPRGLNVTYYAQRASAGLLITEASPVSPLGHGYPATPGIHTEAQVTGWQGVTRAVHERGGHIFLQLWHVGRISHPNLLPPGEVPVAPSAIRPMGEAMTNAGPQPFVTPRALELSEIPGIVQQYRQAAENALRAGFDGVEIHAANGYLLDQFLRDGTNRRDDAYGGSLQNRTRLLIEVADAVTAVWGAGRVGVRLSPLQPFNDMRDSNPETTFSYVVERLNDFDLAYLHVTEMGQDAPGTAGPVFDLGRLRELWHGLYMTNYRYDKARANAALASGAADLIAFGELYIANPDLPERFARGAPLNTPDPATFYGGDEHGYTDYPFMDIHQEV